MPNVSLVIGQAGTGKTTWLMEKAKDYAPMLLKGEHQSMLAITRMHGARRRVKMKLCETCPAIRCSVATIDGFALSILNRWRTALGHMKPVKAADGDVNFADSIFGIEADFARVLIASTQLLQSPTVRRVIGETYPLILIDEFQDCHGPLLDFVKALSECSTLIVAADDFQLLESSVSGCPAAEWLQTKDDGTSYQCTQLTTCHRTSVTNILDAARCLRDNIRATGETIPVFCCPNYGPAAFKIIEALVYHARQWQGSTALICPSHDDFLQQVLASCDSQLQRKSQRPISWFHECAAREEREKLHECLGIGSQTSCVDGWTAPTGDLAPAVAQVVARTQRFSRLRGLQNIPHDVVARHVDAVVHEHRAYCGYSPKRIVTTIHGAKNREFDNVFVLWPYRVISDNEQKRRLLYNAITRSKQNCTLLVQGNLQRVQNDPVLSLLGPAKEAFPSSTNKKSSRGKGKRK